MHWNNLPFLNLLWLLPVLLLLLIYATYRKSRDLKRFTQQEGISCGPMLFPGILRLFAVGFLILALARPCWNPVQRKVMRTGRDVVFLLDVSRSMLAGDLSPSRLERAKLAIEDCLETMQGDRVALMLFAGTCNVRCPLTNDYGFFRMMLKEASPDAVGRGGTNIGDALRTVLKDIFDNQQGKFRDIILLSDGEDQETFAEEAAKEAGAKGIRIISIGLGSPAGSPILIQAENGKQDFIRDEKGKIVRSRLQEKSLRNIATATPGGRYIAVRTGNFDLGEIYKRLIASAEKQKFSSETIEKYEEKFYIFATASLFCLILSFFAQRKIILHPHRSKKFFLFFALLFAAGALHGETLLKQGNALLKQGKYQEAEEKYKAALKKYNNNPYLLYNMGIVKYQQGKYDEASALFHQAASLLKDKKTERNTEFSQGIIHYRNAEKLGKEKKYPEAIQACQAARKTFQEILRNAPKNNTAAYNLAASNALLKKLLMEQKQNQKQNPQKQEPQKQEPQKQEPQKQDPQKQEPQKQDPQKQDPQKQDPQKQDPQKQDPQKQEPQKQEPQKQEPQKQEPQKQEPQKQDPQKQDPQKQEPQKREPQKQGPQKQEPQKQDKDQQTVQEILRQERQDRKDREQLRQKQQWGDAPIPHNW